MSQQYNIVTNVSLGKLLPKKWGVNLPFNYAVGEETITPQYDPFNQDIEVETNLIDVTSDATEKSKHQRQSHRLYQASKYQLYWR